MQSNLVISVGLPLVMFIIMLGLGLSLRLDDFFRVISRPKPLLIGLGCQLLILPIICFALVSVSNLPPAIAVGMMLLAASPGGTSAMLFTHLGKGNVALSLCIVAVTTLLTTITIPTVGNISLEAFFGDTKPITVQFHHVLQIFGIAVIPVLCGVFIHRRWPALSARMEKPVKTLATLFLIFVVIAAVVTEWRVVVEWGPIVGLTVIAFSMASLAVGYYVPQLFQIDRRDAIALAMGVALHNAALVMTLTLNQYMLNEPEMAIPPALYGVTAYIICGAFVWLLNKGKVLREEASS
ncbi:transporter [Nitratireductor aestuarii]|uniref:Transporter n=1 Tax=Nitratireductor aestuarii TaxID=1735103 RepID=A0A916RL71_9HYPH|nr:bile acid:sodium symporter family protein [Nitratireductor aestuarii]GGA60392.1 transporter [Nitratireductor aestuarii]